MKHLLILFLFGLGCMACQPSDPANPAPLTGRSVLVYSTNFPGTFEVTDYDANGIPTQARTSIDYPMYVTPAGRYTSSILLTYDPLLRIKKTVRIYDQLGFPSCCPSSPLHDPDQQLVNEYEYWGNTTKITHELSYSINTKNAQTKPIAEIARTFNEQGQLLQEKNGTKLVYEAAYDANGNVEQETIFPIDGGSSFTRRWSYDYDANNRIQTRRVLGSASFETNRYDEKGRLVRQVSTLPLSAPFIPSFDAVGRLIDYTSFTRASERSTMSFSYFNGQFRPDSPHVLSYEYVGDQTLITNTTYTLWNPLPEISQPDFDFTQVAREKLVTVKETKWRLNKWNKLDQEESIYTYYSERVDPANRDATFAYGNTYRYDDSGNVVSHQGYRISNYQKERSEFSGPVARYKTF
ncbi:hypothetical protein [Spirosoma sp.]|uniref:hypothetical protein n=1 Tax=Spirosoma sp. TaxID=1899569 RepID=UPI003B3BD760